MTRSMFAICTICSLLAILVALPAANADVWNKKTVVTTTGPLEIPGGVVLDPGKYVFRLADSMSNRHIVHVFNERENHVYATILAIPKYRQQPTGDTVITTWETPAGQAPAIRSWFYPGDSYGQEFAYPRQRAAELSQAVGEPVPVLSASAAHDAPVISDPAEDPFVGEDSTEPAPRASAGETAAKEKEPIQMAQNRPQEPLDSPQDRAQAPAQEAEPFSTPDELPQTSSPVAWLGLLSVASLTGATLVAFRRRRR